MKKLFIIIIAILMASSTFGQEVKVESAKPNSFVKNALNFISKLSYSTTISTPSFATNDLESVNSKDASNIGLGDLNVSYKINPHTLIWSKPFRFAR